MALDLQKKKRRAGAGTNVGGYLLPMTSEGYRPAERIAPRSSAASKKRAAAHYAAWQKKNKAGKAAARKRFPGLAAARRAMAKRGPT